MWSEYVIYKIILILFLQGNDVLYTNQLKLSNNLQYTNGFNI